MLQLPRGGGVPRLAPGATPKGWYCLSAPKPTLHPRPWLLGETPVPVVPGSFPLGHSSAPGEAGEMPRQALGEVLGTRR